MRLFDRFGFKTESFRMVAVPSIGTMATVEQIQLVFDEAVATMFQTIVQWSQQHSVATATFSKECSFSVARHHGATSPSSAIGAQPSAKSKRLRARRKPAEGES